MKKKKSKLAQIFSVDPNITIEKEFNTWWERVKPPEYEESFKSAVKNAYYAGAGNMGFIMTQLSKGEPKVISGAIVDKLFEEIQDYFMDLVDDIETAHKERFRE
jgi:hypothetical protein